MGPDPGAIQFGEGQILNELIIPQSTVLGLSKDLLGREVSLIHQLLSQRVKK
jgi:hypothetical protein